MRTWILVSILTIMLGGITLSATGPDAKELAQRGYSTFKEVLAGDEAKWADAVRYMEEARKADEMYVANLYNLARAYLFDAFTFGRQDSLAKAEKTFARMIEIAPNRVDGMAFHGSILSQMSGGRDLAMFMRGAQELRTALQQDPNDLTVRIVLGITALNVPPEARPALGLDDPVANFKFIADRFAGLDSDFAPHAAVVMNAFIGEAQMMAGEKENGRASLEKALKVPEPVDEGQLAGRKLLDDVIKARLNGGDKPVFANAVFSGCHSCHLAAPDKLLKR
jgi:hypothetical protein